MSKKILFLSLCSACLLYSAQKDHSKSANSIAEVKKVMTEVKEHRSVYNRPGNPHLATYRTKKLDGDPDQRNNIQDKK